MSDNGVVVGHAALALEDVARVAHGCPVSLAPQARDRVHSARRLVERKALQDRPVYGVSTGFGALAEIKIPAEQIALLQRNLLLSHSAGVGNPLGRHEVRAMMLLRSQTLAAGCSGVRVEIIERLLALLNAGVHPQIPEKGSVGASGDLAPLAHLALTLIGEGKAEFAGMVLPAREALARAGLEPVVLQAKEGLSLVNGTQAMAALGTLNVLASEGLCELADITGAMSLEGLGGLPSAFDARIAAARPHPGAIRAAANLRALCANSPLYLPRSDSRVQDPYSLRCMPQVHGASRDALAYCRSVLELEINSVTDNPLVFIDEDEILCGGNFHGQPLALMLDFAAIALAELANIAERRMEQMLNPTLSGLPAFLVPHSGIHSGYMIAQLTAASLVNENKMWCTPASVDSIPGNASREDHVSMGMTSARKLREVVKNVRTVLSLEAMCAAQAITLRRPDGLGEGVAAAYACIRKHLPPLTEDRIIGDDIEAITSLVESGSLQAAVRP